MANPETKTTFRMKPCGMCAKSASNAETILSD